MTHDAWADGEAIVQIPLAEQEVRPEARCAGRLTRCGG